MKIIISRDIEIKSFEVIAEMRFDEIKPAYQKVLDSIRKQKQVPSIDLITPFFSKCPEEMRKSIASRILEYFVEENLVNQKGLTKLGEKVADSGAVPVLEKGKYQLWIIDDPLFGKAIIHFERVESDFAREKVEYGFPYKDFLNNSYTDAISKQKFVIQKYESPNPNNVPFKQRNFFNTTIKLVWEISYNPEKQEVEQSQLKINGSLKRFKDTFSPIDLPLMPISIDNIDTIITQIVQPDYEWKSEVQALSLEQNQITPDGYESFKTDINCKNKQILDYGYFSDITITEIPITAKTGKIATAWFYYRLKKKVKENYYSKKEYMEFLQSFRKNRLMKLFGTDLNIPIEDACAYFQSTSTDECYWHIQTMLDLSTE
jgi:hypothetical protein